VAPPNQSGLRTRQGAPEPANVRISLIPKQIPLRKASEQKEDYENDANRADR